MFNVGMDSIEHDWSLIIDLGGPTKVAELLDFPKAGGPQRVGNWKSRGIPPSIKVLRPDLFLSRQTESGIGSKPDSSARIEADHSRA